MSAYIYPVQMGFFIFPVLAAVFTLPYMIMQYRKYGAMLLTRIIIVYSLILYLLCAYFMVILPLPKEDVSRLQQTMQLVPFHFIDEIRQRQLTSFTAFIRSPQVYQAFFNLLLTLPFGVYLRYYFNKKWYHAVIYGFLLSLSFELLQLTGLLGYYRYPYRLFDVDDLIINTLGSLCGFIVAPLCSLFLPSRQQLDERAYAKGKQVSMIRKLLAFGVDYIIVLLATVVIDQFDMSFSYLLTYGFMVLFYFGVLTHSFHGQTFGMKLVKIALRDNAGQIPKFYQYLQRYSVLLMEIYLIPCFMIDCFRYSLTLRSPYSFILWLEMTVIGFFLGVFLFKMVLIAVFKNDYMTYENFSHTYCISLVYQKRHDRQ